MDLRPIPALLVVASLSLPVLSAGAQSGAVMPAPPTARGDAIQVQELPALNPNEVGLLDEQHGGLGLDLWRGTSLGLIGKGLPLLPEQPGWRTLRALQLRLLQSTASLPTGILAGEPVIALRAGKLSAMGAHGAALALLRLVPGPAMTPLLRHLVIDNALADGAFATACDQEAALRSAQGGDNYTIELQVFCQFAAGHGNDAGLGVDLLRDQKLKDPLFFAAAEVLGGLPPVRLDAIKEFTPQSLAIASLARLALPETLAATAPPALLPILAGATGAPTELRLAAAERGIGLGSVPAAQLRILYDALPFTPADLAAAASESGRTVKGRALLYRAAAAEPLPVARTEMIQRGLAADAMVGTQLYAPLLAALPATPDLIAFAPWVVRALLAAGQTEAARPWFDLLKREGPLRIGGETTLAALLPLARLAGLVEPLSAADLIAWRQARNESPIDSGKHGLFLLCLLSALGDALPEDERLALLDGPAVISGKVSRSALAIGLATAAAARRRGETVLYVLLGLGEQRDVEPAEFARLIGDLRAVGLDGDARALALELALAFGI